MNGQKQPKHQFFFHFEPSALYFCPVSVIGEGKFTKIMSKFLMRINFSAKLIRNPKRCVLFSLVLRTFSFSCNYPLTELKNVVICSHLSNLDVDVR